MLSDLFPVTVCYCSIICACSFSDTVWRVTALFFLIPFPYLISTRAAHFHVKFLMSCWCSWIASISSLQPCPKCFQSLLVLWKKSALLCSSQKPEGTVPLSACCRRRRKCNIRVVCSVQHWLALPRQLIPTPVLSVCSLHCVCGFFPGFLPQSSDMLTRVRENQLCVGPVMNWQHVQVELTAGIGSNTLWPWVQEKCW